MTYQEQVVKAQVKSGGSSVLVWAMGVAAVGCVALVVGCGDETTIIESSKHDHPKVEPIECEKEHCDDDDHSSILYDFSVGEIYYNSHADARITIGSIGNTVSATIGINGSQQFTVRIDGVDMQELIVDNPDWSLNVSASEQ